MPVYAKNDCLLLLKLFIGVDATLRRRRHGEALGEGQQGSLGLRSFSTLGCILNHFVNLTDLSNPFDSSTVILVFRIFLTQLIHLL